MQAALARTTELMQDAQDILQDVLQQDTQTCIQDNILDLTRFAELSAPRQRQLLSGWMKGVGLYRPSLDMVQRLQREVMEARPDAQAALHWQGFYYVRFQQQVHKLEKAAYLPEKIAPEQQMICQIGDCLELPCGQFQIRPAAYGLSLNLLKQNLKLTQRQGGEKIHLHGRIGSWPLKKAIQDAQIFPWMRHTIQILSIDNVMLGVFTPKGFWLAESAYCTAEGWRPVSVSSISAHDDEH